ncbi:MAG: tRNA pseudouridine(38-40) synthase TruA [Bacilli bacterium]|nr:tRNA pseudouridine(38-40) synthase TruA [Bacilli bacterium]
MRYLITFSYDGSNFFGYQKQLHKRTIQNEIEKALFLINGNKNVSIHASGRTDALVHALNQKAHFDLNKELPCLNIKNALNSLLPKDIYIKNVEQVNNNFHARFDVKYKEYKYIINTGLYNPIERNYVYQYNKNLDIDNMKKGIELLIGTHNFKSFCKTNNEQLDYIRTIIKANIEIEDDKIILTFKGNGFLRYMIRNMVGTLIKIGENKINYKEINNILKKENRIYAFKTANAEGLYLNDVFYKE